jgi:hypothetical protein
MGIICPADPIPNFQGTMGCAGSTPAATVEKTKRREKNVCLQLFLSPVGVFEEGTPV